MGSAVAPAPAAGLSSHHLPETLAVKNSTWMRKVPLVYSSYLSNVVN